VVVYAGCERRLDAARVEKGDKPYWLSMIASPQGASNRRGAHLARKRDHSASQ
jgi:hypothetical protein